MARNFLRRNCHTKAFFAQISYDGPPFHKGTDINLFVEPGNIYIRMVDWDDNANVSGTSINEDYDTYILEREAQWNAVYWNRERRKWRKIVLI